MCHLVARGIYIRWQHLIFVLCTIVQLYKEDWGILHMLGCEAIALPSTEQIVCFHFHLHKYSLMGITVAEGSIPSPYKLSFWDNGDWMVYSIFISTQTHL